MKEVEIKDISGKTRFSTPINKGAKGKFTLMKEDYIILPFSVSKPIPFKLGDYVDLAGVLDESLGGKMSKIYEITDIQKPTYNTSTGGYDYNLQMNAYYWKWKNKIFKYTPENAGSEASWSLTASLDVQLGVFLRNLKALGYTYRGQDFEFEIDSTVENKAVAMTYDNINLLDALFSMAGEDQWNCDCWITDNVIHFGRCEFGDAVKIERDVEAASITRSDSQGTYATRIYAFGGTKNIPSNYGKKFIDSVSFIQGDVRFTGLLHNTNYYLNDGADVQVRFLTGADENKIFSVRWTAGNFYFQNEDVCNASVGDRFELLNFSDDVPDRYLSYGTEDLVVNGVVQKRLMMPADTPYIDVFPDMTQEEAIEGIVVFDDIYPKRVGTMSDINTVPRDIKEDGKVVGTFDAYQFKDAGLVFDEKYQIEGTELKIIFQSGKMNGMEFGVIFDPDDKDEQLWEIVRSEDYGRPLPDEYIHPENGDQYVLSGFNIKLVSDQYIPDAEQELKEKAQKYADKVKIDDGTYPTTLRSDWVKEDLISRTFDFGQRINLVDDTFFEDGRISRVLGWEMNLDIPWDSPVYTIGESMPYSRIEEIEDKVDSIVFNGKTYTGIYGSGGSNIYVIKTNDSTSASDNNVFSALRSLATFLRKDKADSTSHLLTLLAGAVFGENKASIDANGLLTVINAIIKGDIKSDNFLAGALGSGYAILKKDADGKSYLEVDKIFARVKAIFAVLEIMKVTYTGGNFVFSPAGMNCTKVEEYDTYYRCYFTADDGEKAVENTFEVDDFVQLREFNVKPGAYENISNRYFWRRCIAKGSDYIDLSKSDRDMTSDDAPMAGDSLVTIGNKTIKSRQNVIIISVYGEGSPSIIQYAGVSDYNLDGKAVTVISPNGNKFTGSFVIEATGKNVEDEISAVGKVANTAQETADQAQKDADKANTELATIASDNYITPSEKTALKQQQADIQAERNEIVANATKYGVSYTAYNTAYTLANNALTKYTASSPQNIEVGSDYSNISAYYSARKIILDSIATAAKKLVDDTNSDLQNYKKTVTQEFEAADGRLTSAITETKTYTDNAIGNIQIGNRNILRNSGEKIIPNATDYLIHTYESAVQFKSGGQYTVVIKGSTSAGQAFGLWINGPLAYAGEFPQNMQREAAYKYINIPSNAGTPSVSTLNIYNKPNPNGASKPCEIEWVAMYEGHIKPPMDWTPAPEDLTTKIEENSSKIEQLPDQITLSVDQKIKDIQVGGRNLLLNSDFSNGTNSWGTTGNTYTTTILENGGVRISYKSGTASWGYINQVIESVKANTDYVFSIKARADRKRNIKFALRQGLSGNLGYAKIISLSTEFTTQSVLITTGEDKSYCIPTIVLQDSAPTINDWIEIEWVQLEQGNKATDWSPAPEDLTSKIEENSSKIEQLPNQISLTVKKDITVGNYNYISGTSTPSVLEVTPSNLGFTHNYYIQKECAGKRIATAVKVKIENGVFGSSSYLVFQVVPSSGWPNWYQSLITGANFSANGEYLFFGTTIAPSGLTGPAKLNLRLVGITSGTITISEIRCYEVDSNPSSESEILPWYPSKWDTEVLSSEIKQTADSISLKVNKVIGGINLLSNSSFSADLNGWSLKNSSTGMTSNIVSVGGYKCLELWTDGTERGLYANIDDSSLVNVGDNFTISFDLYRASTEVGTLAIGMEDEGYSQIKKTLSGSLRTWVRLKFTQTMKTTNAKFIIYGAGNSGAVYIKNVKVEMGSVATSWTPSPLEQNNKLLATGIDIYNKRIDIIADKLNIKTNSGTSVAVFDGTGDTPKLKAENIDVENLYVKHLSGANGDFKGRITADGAVIGGFSIKNGYLYSIGEDEKGLAFTSEAMSNYFENNKFEKDITTDAGINDYVPKSYHFTIRGNRKSELRSSEMNSTDIYIADMMNIQYKSFYNDAKYGYQYAMLGSGHLLLDGVVDGTSWGHCVFSADNKLWFINPQDVGNRIIIAPAYNNDGVIFPTLAKMLMFIGMELATRTASSFTFSITIVNQSANKVFVIGRANLTVGSTNLNMSQLPLFYTKDGSLIDAAKEFYINPYSAKQFMLTYDGTGGEYYAFEL